MIYASAHADMASVNRRGCHTTSSDNSATYNFGKQGGVTNGAAWYSLKGGRENPACFKKYALIEFILTLHGQIGMVK